MPYKNILKLRKELQEKIDMVNVDLKEAFEKGKLPILLEKCPEMKLRISDCTCEIECQDSISAQAIIITESKFWVDRYSNLKDIILTMSKKRGLKLDGEEYLNDTIHIIFKMSDYVFKKTKTEIKNSEGEILDFNLFNFIGAMGNNVFTYDEILKIYELEDNGERKIINLKNIIKKYNSNVSELHAQIMSFLKNQAKKHEKINI